VGVSALRFLVGDLAEDHTSLLSATDMEEQQQLVTGDPGGDRSNKLNLISSAILMAQERTRLCTVVTLQSIICS
jgi:hypothetical protein